MRRPIALATFTLAFSLSAAAAMAADVAPFGIDVTLPKVDAATAASKDSGTLMRAHPEMKAVIQKLMDLGAKPVSQLTVDAARTQPTPADAVAAIVAQQTGEPATPEAVGSTIDLMIDGAAGPLKARVYTPAGAGPFPVIVYFHGGGWVIATIDTYDASARALTNQAKAIVVSVEYRKAPENKFPAAHDDALAAYKYVVQNAGKWNGDTKRVALAGESAGGNMAVATAIAARDQKLEQPVAILAVYPVAGNDLNTPSYIANQNAVPLGKADIQWFLDKLLTSPDQASDPRLNLVADDLKGLPPTTIIAAEIDPLQSEGQTLAKQLQAAGNMVDYKLYSGVTHEFFGMGALVPEAKAAEAAAGADLRKAFDEP